MLSFWMNSIQNTLPDPVNLRRWGKQQSAQCILCGWKSCTLIHILCSCKVALDQGRISWRHDSVLSAIVKFIKKSKLEHCKSHKGCGKQETKAPLFIKKGQKPKKRQPLRNCYWSKADDWKILMDTRQLQYSIPPQIAATLERPDVCVYSLEKKLVLFIELTSPAEENITYWSLKKATKYMKLVELAKANGFNAICRTIEVGARGFVSKPSMNVFSLLGITESEKTKIRKELSRVAIRCSHYIWINRENKQWSSPSRLHSDEQPLSNEG